MGAERMGRALSPKSDLGEANPGRWPGLVCGRAYGPLALAHCVASQEGGFLQMFHSTTYLGEKRPEKCQCVAPRQGRAMLLTAPKAHRYTSLGQRPRKSAQNPFRAESPIHFSQKVWNRLRF